MILIASSVLPFFAGLSIGAAIPLLVVAVFLFYLFDVLTVRLVVAGKWRGLLGYEV